MSEMPKSKIQKVELVLSIASEGDGLNIIRTTFENGLVQFIEKRSTAFDADDLDMTKEEFEKLINQVIFYTSFEEFWGKFSKMKGVTHLHYYNIHSDYRELIEKTIPKYRIED